MQRGTSRSHSVPEQHIHILQRGEESRRWVTSSLQSLCRYERRTRLNESIHLVGFIGFTVLASHRFASGSLTAIGFTAAMALNLIFGLWPVVLQRYNRLRLYRAIVERSHLSGRLRGRGEVRGADENTF